METLDLRSSSVYQGIPYALDWKCISALLMYPISVSMGCHLCVLSFDRVLFGEREYGTTVCASLQINASAFPSSVRIIPDCCLGVSLVACFINMHFFYIDRMVYEYALFVYEFMMITKCILIRTL